MPYDDFRSLISTPTTGFLLKLFAGLATAGFGLLGIGSVTRDHAGKLTRSGWIAFTGILVGAVFVVGACLYDFVTGQESERLTKIRSQQLLMSVRRGIFPMRSLRISAEVLMAGDVAPLKSFKSKVRDLATRDRTCKAVPHILRCNGISIDGSSPPVLYEVKLGSALFPKEGSDIRRLIDFIYVHVSILRETSIDDSAAPQKGQQRRAQYLGRFFAGWDRQGLPKDTLLSYNYRDDTLTLAIEDLAISDAEVITAGLYSLVDFLPGYMRLIPNLAGDPMCSGRPDVGICSIPETIDFIKGLSLTSFRMSFPYPKEIRAYASPDTTCAAAPGNGIATGLAVELPFDVEGLDSLGNIVSPAKLPPLTKSVCELTNDQNALADPTTTAFAAARASVASSPSR